MAKDLTFREVSKLLEKKDGKLIEAFDKLLGLTLVCAPAVLGPPALVALPLLRAKGELTDIGKSLLDRVTAKKKQNFLARAEQIRIVYVLICYTAFFEALDSLLPAGLRKKIALRPKEKQFLAKRATEGQETGPEGDRTVPRKEEEILGQELSFPHPAAPADHLKRIEALYERLTKGLTEFLGKLAVFEKADDKTMAQLHKIEEKLPELAMKYFEGQFFELARKYQDFYLWSQIIEQKATRAKLKEISEHLELYASLLSRKEKSIDVGFENLARTVLATPEHFEQIAAEDIVEGLRLDYEEQLKEPIIGDTYKAGEGAPSMAYPVLAEAFIPQSYKVCWYKSKEIRLEKEGTWGSLERNENLNRFLLDYLSSPYSVETPLLILGHPGSGKSVLTKALSAKLMSTPYTVVRVPLREVDVDSSVESQIEQAIGDTTGHRIDNWASFSKQFRERPLFVILDGYDELLQASGQVYAGYLDSIRHFMQRERTQKRPVRVAVTSRITLIDKALIPLGATVIRLMDFNKRQQDAWIGIWNRANADYFSSFAPPLKPFEVPSLGSSKEGKIAMLAKQPLLLLMLALYDSEGNRLSESKRLDRTVLYDSLLRRFIRRERSRYVDGFLSLNERTQKKEIDREMKRLGVAALGMYNRRKLHVLYSELESDIEFFNLRRQMNVREGQALSQADFLLGSFFFVHKARAGQQRRDETRTESDTAFEFLHNTFGEFLTADSILQHLFQETETLRWHKEAENMAEIEKKVQHPDGLLQGWFACLMHAPLHSRPVVLEMLREWASHMFQARNRSRDEFLENFDEIHAGQIGQILGSRELPSALGAIDASQGAEPTLLGRLAIYTMNLVILRTVLTKGTYVLDESRCGLSIREDEVDTGTRHWDKLLNIWRSWFSLESLNGISAILHAKRDESKIHLTSHREFQTRSAGNRFETALSVASTLADDLNAGIAGLLSMGDVSGGLSVVEDNLVTEGIETVPEVFLGRLNALISCESVDRQLVVDCIFKGFENIFASESRTSLVCGFLDAVHNALLGQHVPPGAVHRVVEQFLHPNFVLDFARSRHKVMLRMLRLVCQFGGHHWGQEFGANVFRTSGLQKHLTECDSVDVVEWLVLVHKFGGPDLFEELIGLLVERIEPEIIVTAFLLRPEIGIDFLETIYYGRQLEGIDRDRLSWLIEEALQSFRGDSFKYSFPGQKGVIFGLLGLGRILRDNRRFDLLRRKLLRSTPPREVTESLTTYPDAAIEVLRAAYDAGDSARLDSFWTSVSMSTDPRSLAFSLKARPEVAIELMKGADNSHKNHWPRRFAKEFFSCIEERDIGRVPLAYLADLSRFAAGDDRLRRKIERYLN